MKQHRQITNRIAQRISFAIIACIIAFIFACIFTGCKTPAAVSTQTDVQDSTRIEYRIVHDTIIQHDTVYINEKTVKDSETESETTIHFGDGGGTYNSKTGDATNVTGVGTKESKREKEQKEHIERMASENTQLRHSLDSLRKVNTIIHEGTEAEPVEMTKWQRFFHTSGIIAWCVLAILAIIGIVKLLRKLKVIPV